MHSPLFQIATALGWGTFFKQVPLGSSTLDAKLERWRVRHHNPHNAGPRLGNSGTRIMVRTAVLALASLAFTQTLGVDIATQGTQGGRS